MYLSQFFSPLEASFLSGSIIISRMPENRISGECGGRGADPGLRGPDADRKPALRPPPPRRGFPLDAVATGAAFCLRGSLVSGGARIWLGVRALTAYQNRRRSNECEGWALVFDRFLSRARAEGRRIAHAFRISLQ